MLEWSEELSVGSAEMDGDHRDLIDLVNRVALTDLANDPAAFGVLLDEVIAHLGDHFRREERLMRAAGYPGLFYHRGSHASLLADVQALRHKGAEGDRAGGPQRLLALLVPWLPAHIMNEDKLYALHLGGAGKA
ncbi:MAG: bacteriohemerythrin [Alphaproteobacteria bacterium]